MNVSLRTWVLIGLCIALSGSFVAAQVPEVTMRVRTTSGDSIFSPGEDIIWTLDAQGYEVQGISLTMYVTYTNTNILGPMLIEGRVVASEKAHQAFEQVSEFNPTFGCDAPFPTDSMTVGFIDFDGSGWTGAGTLFHIGPGASDTGTIRFDSTFLPPSHFGILTDSGFARVIWDVPVLVVDEAYHLPGGPVPVVRVETTFGNDTLFVGGPSSLSFVVDPVGFELNEIWFPAITTFTNGNIIGPIRDGVEFLRSDLAVSTFETIIVNWAYGDQPTDPDTLLWGMYNNGPGGLTVAGELMRIEFEPLDTGSFTMDTTMGLSQQLGFSLYKCDAGRSVDWQPLTVHVVPCPVLMGDCNEDGIVTSADIIWYVNYMFKSGPDPLPMRTVGDVNCSGGLSGADIIYLVNYFFRSGPPPCGCYVREI